MKLKIILFVSFFCLCIKGQCNQLLPEANNLKEIKNEQLINDTINLSGGIDSLKITCLMFGNYIDNSFIFYLSNNNFFISSFNNEHKKIAINSICKKNNIISYINNFYIDKTDSIVLNRKERNGREFADYPFIEIVVFKKGNSVIIENRSIGEEDYDVKYNPKFLEFYSFLKKLIEENIDNLLN